MRTKPKPSIVKQSVSSYLIDVTIALVALGELTAHDAALAIGHNARDVAEAYVANMSAADCAYRLEMKPSTRHEEMEPN